MSQDRKKKDRNISNMAIGDIWELIYHLNQNKLGSFKYSGEPFQISEKFQVQFSMLSIQFLENLFRRELSPNSEMETYD